MTQSPIPAKYANKSKAELVDEIARLSKELRAKTEENEILKKRIRLYDS
jgi:hypothetical protein